MGHCVTGLWQAVGNVNVDREVSGRQARAGFRVRCSLSCAASIRLWLHLKFRSNVRATVILNYSVTVKHG